MASKTTIKACLLAALVAGTFSTIALADPDDNYFWQTGNTYTGPVNAISFNYKATSSWQGEWARISSSTDRDYHLVSCGAPDGANANVYKVSIEFTHANGDLDIEAYTVDGKYLGASRGVTDQEVISLSAAAKSSVVLKVYGWNGAVNGYGYTIRCF